MSFENRFALQRKLDICLENKEAKTGLVQFFELLIKIDDKERIIKSPNSNNTDAEEINND